MDYPKCEKEIREALDRDPSIQFDRDNLAKSYINAIFTLEKTILLEETKEEILKVFQKLHLLIKELKSKRECSVEVSKKYEYIVEYVIYRHKLYNHYKNHKKG